MRIAFFLASFPVVSETFILRQITGLLDLGHEVDIYAEWPAEEPCVHAEVQAYQLLDHTVYVNPSIPPDSGYWEMPVWPITGETWLPGAEKPIPNVRRVIRALPTLCRCLLTYPRLTLHAIDVQSYGYQASSLSTLYRLATLSKQAKRYDVLHGHFGPVGNTFRFTRELWKSPFIVSFHGYDFCRVPRSEGSAVYENLFHTADVVTVNSTYMSNELAKLNCPLGKLHTLRYGIDLDQFRYRNRTRQSDRPVRVLTVARLVEKKGLEYSIQAVSQLCEKYSDLRYDIIGDGPLRSHLQLLVDRLGIGNQVTLHGARNGTFVRDMMEQADLFMLTSVTAADGDQEGTPVSLLEAQAVGLPVISTFHSGIPEIVLDGQSGFLVPERDSGAIANRLKFFLDHPGNWNEFGRLGRRHIEEHYDMTRIIHHLVTVYQDAVVRYGTPPLRRHSSSYESSRKEIHR